MKDNSETEYYMAGGNVGRGSSLSVRVLNVRIIVQGQGSRQLAVTVSESG
jgi:hypothetical protein